MKEYYESEITKLRSKLEGSTKGMIEEIKDNHKKEVFKVFFLNKYFY